MVCCLWIGSIHVPKFKPRVAMEAISSRKSLQEMPADHVPQMAWVFQSIPGWWADYL